LDRTIAIAPMMDWTDRHCRYFHRLISKKALLYTEMMTTSALIHGESARLLQYHADEHPIALQLGGSDPVALTQCAIMAEQAGYDEINLNVGCPSDRVQSGQFGLCLMKFPERVAACVQAMKQAVSIPVTVKIRTGVDEQDSAEHLHLFVALQLSAGADHICIHARKGWLQGLSPKENRDIPPLNYPKVYHIKQAFPDANLGINGGITTLEQAREHLLHVDAVMIGRAAYHNPYLLAQVDNNFYHKNHSVPSRSDIIEALLPYVAAHIGNNGKLNHITRHILGLFQGQPGAKKWRQTISQQAHLPGAGIEVLQQALMATTHL